jgi:hypothetical protein
MLNLAPMTQRKRRMGANFLIKRLRLSTNTFVLHNTFATGTKPAILKIEESTQRKKSPNKDVENSTMSEITYAAESYSFKSFCQGPPTLAWCLPSPLSQAPLPLVSRLLPR